MFGKLKRLSISFEKRTGEIADKLCKQREEFKDLRERFDVLCTHLNMSVVKTSPILNPKWEVITKKEEAKRSKENEEAHARAMNSMAAQQAAAGSAFGYNYWYGSGLSPLQWPGR